MTKKALFSTKTTKNTRLDALILEKWGVKIHNCTLSLNFLILSSSGNPSDKSNDDEKQMNNKINNATNVCGNKNNNNRNYKKNDNDHNYNIGSSNDNNNDNSNL